MDEILDKTWTIVRLKAYLSENGGRLSGNKTDLLRLAILYADDFESWIPLLRRFPRLNRPRRDKFSRAGQLFGKMSLKTKVPELFDLKTINLFLTSTTFHLGGEDDDDENPKKLGSIFAVNLIRVQQL
jgi:hypothetical protein